MAMLTWDGTGQKLFETGTDRGVLYVLDSNNEYKPGVAWNGLTSVTESPSGADSNKQYADNTIYANLRGAEEFGGTIEAFTYPDEWAVCDGSVIVKGGIVIGQQGRRTFGFSFRTKIGNDVDSLDHGYKLHLIYGATASPSERSYETVNDSPEAATLSWEFDTVPVDVTINGVQKKVSLLTIDSTKVAKADLTKLETALYGGESADPYLPTPDQVIAMFTTTP